MLAKFLEMSHSKPFTNEERALGAKENKDVFSVCIKTTKIARSAL